MEVLDFRGEECNSLGDEGINVWSTKACHALQRQRDTERALKGQALLSPPTSHHTSLPHLNTFFASLMMLLPGKGPLSKLF